jgi:hypothetical protein
MNCKTPKLQLSEEDFGPHASPYFKLSFLFNASGGLKEAKNEAPDTLLTPSCHSSRSTPGLLTTHQMGSRYLWRYGVFPDSIESLNLDDIDRFRGAHTKTKRLFLSVEGPRTSPRVLTTVFSSFRRKTMPIWRKAVMNLQTPSLWR